ncbi:hypothetical protein PIECOFPK_02748 [Mycovorax composti]|jgi:Universal stress protein UspA and related nucleotide-binding proteins|uniref:Universal stress protein n=2 Tax=Chitinophagaceae TaxID=563835 RepID=A0ABZ2EN49_9BACT
MEKFIVALDLQEDSSRVLLKAVEIAQRYNAELHMVHVVPPIGSYIGTALFDPMSGMDSSMLPNGIEMMESQQKAAEESMEMLAKSMPLQPQAIKVFLGETEDEILNYAQEIQAALIILGTHQHSGLFRLFSRETAVKMLHETQIPILVIPIGANSNKD